MKKRFFAIIIIIVLLVLFSIPTLAYNTEFYDEEHDWLFHYGMQDGYSFEVYIEPYQFHHFNIRFVVAPLDNSQLSLTLQSVVTYSDDSFDLSIDNGITDQDSMCEYVYKEFAFEENMTVVTLDFDCHIFDNNVYQTTIGMRLYY